MNKKSFIGSLNTLRFLLARLRRKISIGGADSSFKKATQTSPSQYSAEVIRGNSLLRGWGRTTCFIILTLAVLILTSLPAVFTALSVYPEKFTVPVGPYGEGDYYYDRIGEIKDGHPLIGNPYFFEHRKEIAPAFFLADWIAAIPTLLGFSLLSATLINFFIWSLITVLIIFLIFKKIGIGDRWSLVGSILCYLNVYVFMIRPVSMQIVFPFFFLFILALFYWLDFPDKKKNIFVLSAMAAISAYFYSYTAQIVLVLYVIFAIYFWLRRDPVRLKGIAISGAYFMLMIIPFVLFTIKQMAHPFYFETMKRIGLMETHIPIGLFFISGFFVASGIICCLIVFFSKKGNDKVYFSLPFFALLGFILVGVSGSNIITGKELENAQHFERYMIPWLLMITVVLLWLIFKEKIWQSLNVWAKVFLVIFFSVVVFADVRYLIIYGPTSFIERDQKVLKDWKDAQIYGASMGWIDKREKDPVVVWANTDNKINSYITMLSSNYPLFHMGGILHLVSSEESAERFMVSKYFDLTKDVLKSDFKMYAGTGNAIHPYMTHNRKVKFCKILFLEKFGINCGEMKDAISFQGEKYFDDLYDEFISDIKPKIKDYLYKYRVKYAIKDVDRDFDFRFEELGGKLVNKTRNFEIYEFGTI